MFDIGVSEQCSEFTVQRLFVVAGSVLDTDVSLLTQCTNYSMCVD